MTGTTALVTGASGCPATGEAVCCPVVAAPAVDGCVLPVPAALAAVVFWTVPEAELVEVVAAAVAVVADWPVPVPEEPEEPALDLVAAEADWPVVDWLVVKFELPVPDWLVPEPWEPVLAPVVLVAEEPVLGLLVAEAEEPVLAPVVLVAEEPELVPLELAPAVAEPDCPVRGCDAALTAEPTTELAVETGESAEVGAVPEGCGGSVAACACRENTSMMRKIPAATIASCTARRAMRRAIGCGMSDSHRRIPDLARLPVFRGPMPRAEAFFVSPKPDVVFGHHRTTTSPDDARGSNPLRNYRVG